MGSGISEHGVSTGQAGTEDIRLFRTIVEASSSAVFIFQGEQMRYVNPAALSISGYSEDELLLMPFRAIIHEDFQDLVKQRVCSLQAGDIPANYDVKIARKDGETRWVNFRTSMIELDGEPAVLGMAEGISASKQQASALNFRNLVEADCFALIVHRGFHLLYANAETLKMFEIPDLDSLLGKSIFDYIYPRFHRFAKLSIQRVIRRNESISPIQIKGVTANGRELDIDLRSMPVHFDDSPAVMSIIFDITARKRAEEALLESEKRLQDIIEANPIPIIITRMSDGLVKYANQPVAALFRTEMEIIGKKTPDYFVHSEERDSILQELARAGGIQAREIELRRPDGSMFCAMITLSVLTFDGEPSVMASIYDITERKQTENELQQKKAQYKSLYSMLRLMCDNMPDMIWAKDTDKRYLFTNKALCDNLLHAKDTDEPVGKPDMFFAERERAVHPDDPEWHTFGELCRDSDTIALESGKAGQFDVFGNIRRKFLYLDVRKAPMVDANGQVIGVVGSARDVTEIREAEMQLRTLSSAIEQAGESVIITDTHGIIEYVNPAFSKITGYQEDEIIGKTPSILKSDAQDPVFYKDLWETINRGDVWHGTLIDKKKDGTFYPAMMSVAPIHDDHGKNTHYVAIQQDMTNEKRLEEQFHQAQKMEAIGTLVGGIAHDFNNMLAGMTGNAYLIKQRTREMPEVAEKLANIEQLSFRAADMIQQLLTFARKSMVSMKAISITPFIKEILKLLRSSVPENIKMHQDICAENLKVNGDSTQLHQVLMNLVSNARDAVEGVENPCISIRLEAWHADQAFIEHHPYVKNKPYAHISVQDNGTGIPEYQIKHLFDPFFTTKEVGKGTGLGLSMVFGAIKTHHGFVEVESREGEGSTFHVYIPLLQAEEIVLPPPQEKMAARGHGEMILLVDDERNIIETSKEVLESLGYRVLTAANGQQAVEIFKAHSKEIDLCIFDIVMPVLGGDKAAVFIRRIDPHVKIIFSTGYDKSLLSSMEHEAVLSKPFPIEKISHLIRQKLDS